jgi:hypothetical protein
MANKLFLGLIWVIWSWPFIFCPKYRTLYITMFMTVYNKRGTCPSFRGLSRDRRCIEQCRSDRDCRGRKKCCLVACSRVCVEPRVQEYTRKDLIWYQYVYKYLARFLVAIYPDLSKSVSCIIMYIHFSFIYIFPFTYFCWNVSCDIYICLSQRHICCVLSYLYIYIHVYLSKKYISWNIFSYIRKKGSYEWEIIIGMRQSGILPRVSGLKVQQAIHYTTVVYIYIYIFLEVHHSPDIYPGFPLHLKYYLNSTTEIILVIYLS